MSATSSTFGSRLSGRSSRRALSTKKSGSGRTRTSAILSVGTLALVVILWQALTTLFPSAFFPPPTRILEKIWELLIGTASTGSAFPDIAQTMWRALVAFCVAAIVGISAGLAIGLNQVVQSLFAPIVDFLRSIPKIALLPLFIILLGAGDGMRIAFIAFGCCFFILINTVKGVSSIDPIMLDMGRIFRVGRVGQWFRIVLPAALPQIFAGLRLATTMAILLGVLSELFLSSNGMGYRLLIAQSVFNLTEIWAWMIILAVFGLALNVVLGKLQNQLLGWHTKWRG